MRNIVFVIILLLMGISGKAQEDGVIKNEYWTGYYPQIFSSHYNPLFSNFFFSDDGSFTYETGYSGGIHLVFGVIGTYEYNNNKLELRTDSGNFSLNLSWLTDSSVLFTDTTQLLADVPTINTSLNMPFIRRLGNIKNQKWTSEIGGYSFKFQTFGQVTFSVGNSYQLVGYYHLIDNTLFLELRSKTEIGKTEMFSPYTRTYIRLNISEDGTLVSRSDLLDLVKNINNGSGWHFEKSINPTINELRKSDPAWIKFEIKKY